MVPKIAGVIFACTEPTNAKLFGSTVLDSIMASVAIRKVLMSPTPSLASVCAEAEKSDVTPRAAMDGTNECDKGLGLVS
jgi:hypothetical protein